MKPMFTTLLLGLLAQATPAVSAPPDPFNSGKQVYNEVCFACHKTGVADAPRFGNKADWAPLIEEGQGILTGACLGRRPGHARQGRQAGTQVVRVARAVAYMAGEAGGNWKDPDADMMHKIRKEAEERLEKSIKEMQAMKKELHRLNEEDD